MSNTFITPGPDSEPSGGDDAVRGPDNLFTVVERRTISDELAVAAEAWLARYGLAPEVDGTWLELVCEDGDAFAPDKLMLHLAVPPCDVAAGDSVHVGRTQTVGQLWPEADAPPDAVPKALAFARTFERVGNGWVGACELPGPVRQLFTVEQPDAMLAVMTATRRTLGRAAMGISGDPDGRLSFTVVEGQIAAWGSTEAEVPEAFIYWVDAGPAIELARPLEGATRAVGSLGAIPDIIITNEAGVEARCLLDDDRAAPVPLAEDYFGSHAEGRVEGLRVDRKGGLGREALAAIANVRPGEVTLTVDADGSLVIGGGDDSEAGAGAPFKLDGPGFATPDGGPSGPIVVPYVVALAIYDGAAGGVVDLKVDDRRGHLHRADQGVTVEWTRR